ncbi:MAG: 2-oxoacid:acceptor oxidoreductase subunit alpha [Gammaproteobacteria bacterium]|nr:2-oxoacid:acceptor oxidoreductase subunit alpha [Gammaproteobacteria bacterium]
MYDRVLSGIHFMSGNIACAEGAIAAGCRFFAGYPITPSSEIAERLAARLPAVGGTFIQMEDELASSIAIAGASWGGLKSMTATSGPGFSLMQEHIGYAFMTETPVVLVDIQRGGPSTGLPTLVGQGDMMQARWGSHGDYEMIALCPASPQELFDFTLRAFNLAERFRTPVLVMSDEVVGHMVERVEIPTAEALEIVERHQPPSPPEELTLPYHTDEVNRIPPMAPAGEGYRVNMTGLTHDERGYPTMNAEGQDRLVRRLVGKIRQHADELELCVEDGIEDADVVVIAYGITARVSQGAVRRAREAGLKVGLLRLQVAWPFPDARIARLAESARALLVPEINLGQLVREVERAAHGATRVVAVSHAGGHYPAADTILAAIEEVNK